MNIVEEIFSRCEPHAVALVEGNLSITYAQLKELSDEAASSLRRSSFYLPHARVGISIPNGIDHIVWSLAVLMTGGVLVPVPGELTMPEREKLAAVTAVHCIISTEGQPWIGDIGKQEVIGNAVIHGMFAHQPSFNEDVLNGLNPALIRFSSGTTGRSKGVVLSHETLLARVKACNEGLGIGPSDRVLWILPMAHHFAVSIILYLLHGATTVLAKSHLGEDLLLELKNTRATVLYAAPFHYSLLSARSGGERLPHLRLAVSTAAALTANIVESWISKFHLPLTQGMGIIEGGLPLLNVSHALDKPLSVGQPQKAFEICIRGADEEGIGELMLRGPGFFDAYLAPWQLRNEVLEDGWLATGDLAQLGEDGCVTLVGRLKSVINVAGMKCFPEEIEEVLNDLPEVRESRVYGHPHPETGAIPAAEIVLKDPETPIDKARLMKHCRARLAAYKVPLKYQFVDQLRRTASGKIMR